MTEGPLGLEVVLLPRADRVAAAHRSAGAQPGNLCGPYRVAALLERGDGREGGCLLFLAAADAADAERELEERGFDIGIWDNGTPYDEGGAT